MQASKGLFRTVRLWHICLAAALLAVGIWLRRVIGQVAGLALGSGVTAFLALPVARLYEKRLRRPTAAVAGIATLGLALVLLLRLTLPGLVREFSSLAEALPRSLAALNGWLNVAIDQLARAVPGLKLSMPDPSVLFPAVPNLAAGTLSLATGIAGMAGKASMMVILGCFCLSDRERLALRAELMLPARVRPMAVGMGCAVLRELKLYLRAQLLIALSVALAAAAALLTLRVRSALVLGLLIGIMNMIPYFGPFIGGVPAVLIALGDGMPKALLTFGALCLVQQLDGCLISPRIMGSVTGLSPALVLLALFAGAELAGVAGMLFAVPLLIIFRTVFRVYVQRRENI